MQKEELLTLIGEFPAKSLLDARILEEEEEENYIQQKIEYLVGASERVKAYLLIPKNDLPKRPAIFAHHQH